MVIPGVARTISTCMPLKKARHRVSVARVGVRSGTYDGLLDTGY